MRAASCLCGGDGFGFHHGLQHELLPLPGAAEIAGWRELRRRAHQSGQHRSLAETEFAGLLAEISSGGCVHAVGAGAEISRIQIAQQNVFLLELAFQPHRQDRFLDFSAQCPLRGKIHQARKLLGYGASALADAAGLRIAPAGAQYSPEIDTVVLVEPSIFDRDNGLGQMRRQIRSRQLVSLEYAAGGENVALGAFEGQRTLGGFNLKASADRQGGDAVQHISANKREAERDGHRQSFRPEFHDTRIAPRLRHDAKMLAFELFCAAIWPASAFDR